MYSNLLIIMLWALSKFKIFIQIHVTIPYILIIKKVCHEIFLLFSLIRIHLGRQLNKLNHFCNQFQFLQDFQFEQNYLCRLSGKHDTADSDFVICMAARSEGRGEQDTAESSSAVL